VIDIYKAFQTIAIEELLNYIDTVIKEYELTLDNQSGYLALRKHYNETRRPLDLYVLVCYSFNYQFRFNSKHEYNNPFGRERSSFNPVMRNNLIKFHRNIARFNFTAQDFKVYDCSFLTKQDFLYADPPYRIALGSYNDGKRGFGGWTLEDDLTLFELLDTLAARKIKFALSNVVEHKGKVNEELVKWIKRYNVHYIGGDYNNSNYRSTAKRNKTVEILVTNF
jgi:DNA adenine methylase